VCSGAGREGDEANRVGLPFPRDVRVRRRSEYLLAQSRGRRVQAPHFVLIVLPREVSGPARLGITVTKKVGPSAVARNRTKRVLREVFRLNRALFPEGADVIAIAKDGAPALGYADVLAELRGASAALMSAARAGARAPREDDRRGRRAPATKRTS